MDSALPNGQDETKKQDAVPEEQVGRQEAVGGVAGNDEEDQDHSARLLPELLLTMLSYLDTRSLLMARGVSQRWREAAADESLWRKRRLGFDGDLAGPLPLPPAAEAEVEAPGPEAAAAAGPEAAAAAGPEAGAEPAAGEAGLADRHAPAPAPAPAAEAAAEPDPAEEARRGRLMRAALMLAPCLDSVTIRKTMWRFIEPDDVRCRVTNLELHLEPNQVTTALRLMRKQAQMGGMAELGVTLPFDPSRGGFKKLMHAVKSDYKPDVMATRFARRDKACSPGERHYTWARFSMSGLRRRRAEVVIS